MEEECLIFTQEALWKRDTSNRVTVYSEMWQDASKTLISTTARPSDEKLTRPQTDNRTDRHARK